MSDESLTRAGRKELAKRALARSEDRSRKLGRQTKGPPGGGPLDVDDEEDEDERAEEEAAAAEAANNKPDREKALEHLAATSCTVRDDHGNYHWRSLWETSAADLGCYGVGVQLYFNFLGSMIFVFGVLGCLSLPLLTENVNGSMVAPVEKPLGSSERETTASVMAKLSIANLGYCGSEGQDCDTREKMEQRCLADPTNGGKKALTDPVNDPCEGVGKVRDRTVTYGLLDAGQMAFLALFAVLFARFWVKSLAEAQDAANTTPQDFAVIITGLPRRLDENHEAYEERLTAHLEKVFTARDGQWG